MTRRAVLNLSNFIVGRRLFHSAPIARQLRVGQAVVPPKICELFSKKNFDSVVMSHDLLQENVSEVRKILSDEHDFLKLINEYAAGNLDAFVITHNIAQHTGELSVPEIDAEVLEEEGKAIMQKERSGLNFLQVVLGLMGEQRIAADRSIVYRTGTKSQRSHTDGEVVVRDNFIEFETRTVAFYGMQLPADDKIATMLVPMDEVLKKLSPQSIEILKEPLFLNERVKDAEGNIGLVPVLAKNAEGKWVFADCGGTGSNGFYFSNSDRVKAQKMFDALNELDKKTLEVAKEHGARIALKKGADDTRQMLFFRNEKLFHNRTNHNILETDDSNLIISEGVPTLDEGNDNSQRQLVIVSANKIGPNKTPNKSSGY